MFKWSPNFKVDVETSIAPFGVTFPSLPIHLFSKPSLFLISRTLGNSMNMNMATETFARPIAARICIAMDLLRKFPNKLWIGCGSDEFWQKKSYEKIPKFFTVCFKQRHGISVCKLKVLNNAPKEVVQEQHYEHRNTKQSHKYVEIHGQQINQNNWNLHSEIREGKRASDTKRGM